MTRRALVPVFVFLLVAIAFFDPAHPTAQSPVQAPPASATPGISQPEPIDEAMNQRLRSEGLDRSKLMWIAHFLTDVYGPRPTGSPNHVAAANWAIKTMTEWGLTNGHLEPFKWDGAGWLAGRASGYITSPIKMNLHFEATPWTPSTNGTVRGEVLMIAPPEGPTDTELAAYFATIAPQVRGGIVMLGTPIAVPVNFTEPQKRTPDATARARYQPADPNAPARGGRGGGPGGPAGAPAAGRGARGGAPADPSRLTTTQVNQRLVTFLRDNPPALRLAQVGAGRIPGAIVAQNSLSTSYDPLQQICPGVILRNEDYGRIARLLADGTPVTVEFTVSNQYFPEGGTSYVTVAEIAGTDKADEVVMLGGHLDSWTSATGATDNAIGVAIMMEAARILKAVGAKPRRTIRVALWSGEEQGLLGSKAYVAEHFGSAESPKPEFTKLDAYWNIDEGTGRLRGATVFGPPAAAAVLAGIVKPFDEWGIYGASATMSRAEGGSDYGAFNAAGLPGINTIQDPIEYNSTTWHTNLDTYERIVPDDVMKAAVVTASVMYHLANREEMLPRFEPGNMPARGGRGGGAGAPAGGRGGTPSAPTAPWHVYGAAKGKTLTIASPGLVAGIAATGQTPVGQSPKPAAAMVTPPSHGRLTLRPDGSFTYVSARDFIGNDTFTYTVAVAGATSAPATVTMAVK